MMFYDKTGCLIRLPLATIVVMASASPVALHAQDAVAIPEAGGAPAGAQTSEGLAEIIVTAQRRGQNLQNVPIAVSVASGDDLRNIGVRSTADIQLISPSVTLTGGPASGQVFVRGVGGTGGGGDEPANAIYLDGVYLPSPAAGVFEFNSIERVEVLKGPQGTLFGRNASGGLVHVITRTPSFEPVSDGEIGYGNYDTMRAAAYFSTGLSNTIAFNLSGIISEQSKGWGTNLATGRDTNLGGYRALRGKLLWQPGENTTVTAAGLVANTKPATAHSAAIYPGEFGRNGVGNVGFFNSDTNLDTRTVIKEQNYALTVKHEFSSLVLTSITSRDITKINAVVDQDGTRVPIVNLGLGGDVKTWTQEVQLGSLPASHLQWVVGLFYYYNDNLATVTTGGAAVAPLVLSGTVTSQITKSYAAYGQITAPLTDSTSVTGGLRYTQDKRKLSGFSFNNLVPSTPIVPQRKKDEKVTWRLAVDQKLGDRSLIYASYSRGFKSGLFNAQAPTLPPAEPQTIDSIELGLKNELFDRHLRLNMSVFHNDIKDLQVRGIFPGAPTPIFYNASGAKVYGAEVEANLAVTQRLSLGANVTYLHGRFKKGFTNALIFTPRTAPPFGLIQSTGDASGKNTINTPKWVAGGNARYTIPTGFGAVNLSGNYTYNSGYFFDPQNRVGNSAFHLVNANIEFRFGDKISFRLWANNIANEHYYSVVNPSALSSVYLPQAPRTYGAAFGWSFK